MTFEPSPNVTSSQASEGGPTPSSLQDGPATALSGPVVVPASPSAPLAKVKRSPTHVTSGPSGFGSSASAALQSSLENRLHKLLDGVGSTLYRLTWKRKVTPSGRRYCQLVGSAHRTSDNGCGSWATPQAPTGGAQMGNLSEAALKREGERRSPSNCLGIQAQLAAWPTPKAVTGKYQYANGNHGKRVLNLEGAAELPLGPILNGSPAATGKPGQLNPAFSLWLMGFPPEWESCAPQATPSSRKSRKRSSKRT